MKKSLIIAVCILIFWIALPAALVCSSLALDRHFQATHTVSLSWRVSGSALAPASAFLLALSIVQFFRFSRRLPVSALPPARLGYGIPQSNSGGFDAGINFAASLVSLFLRTGRPARLHVRKGRR
jgi:hypothetical protein